MRTSNLLLPTLKETPADAEIISHQLMLRAGMIRRLASGLYSWLPLGLRVLRKIEGIVREEINAAGAQELLMPAVQPAELWQESERWDQYGPELLRFHDRHQREFCYGPTHEEIITDLMRREIRSYKQLPITLYQIQTKFRDEIRPRFGVMRSREFIMKDAYSFHASDDSLAQTYEEMYTAYNRIFTRMGLHFRAVEADSGNIGGGASHEFHVLADAGEDAIAFSDESDYAANIELAPINASQDPRPDASASLETIETYDHHSIEDVSKHLKVNASQCLKTLVVNGSEGGVVALVIRGDHTLNDIKAEKHPAVAYPLTLASDEQLAAITFSADEHQPLKCVAGSIGPKGIDIPVIADHSAIMMSDFICGANQDGFHHKGVNWGRDLLEPIAADLRNIEDGDASPDGKGTITIKRGIEVGHIFQLGKKYSELMKAQFLDENGKSQTVTMGCYGIGISRLAAAAIEQHNDDRGILWPDTIAPFTVALLPLNMHKSERLRTAAEALYQTLLTAGFDVLFDDRKERAGVMFANADLIGIPHRLVIGERGLDDNSIEYKARNSSDIEHIPLDKMVDFLNDRVQA